VLPARVRPGEAGIGDDAPAGDAALGRTLDSASPAVSQGGLRG
jgi:hypothetical protein